MDIAKVHEAALAHYEGLAEDQKQMAQSYFASVDRDGSGNISIDEFIAFLSYLGLQSDYHYWLFAQLDRDNNGTLDFMELVTFFYMLNRDEYKSLFNSQPSTDASHWKARFNRRRNRGVNNKGSISGWKEMFSLLASGIQIWQFLDQNGCTIV